MPLDVIKVFLPTAVAFFIGVLSTPFLTHFLYKHKLWKKKVRNKALGGGATPIFAKLHEHKEIGTPRMGGIVIWGSVFITTLLFSGFALVSDHPIADKLNFLSREQTWLPLFTLMAGALLGLTDDILQVLDRGGYIAGGMALSKRIAAILFLGFAGGWWFFAKLGVSAIHIPFFGELSLGFFIIPLFMLAMLGLFSGGVIDGIDGLAGGVMTSIFCAYATIAFFQNQVDLAVFCAVVAGGTLAFLWFNIPPARFYLSETGMLALTTSLTVVAFLTKAVAVLPIIAFPLVATTLSNIIQIASKKLRHGKKVFLVAPIHHHFEAIGWSGHKVTMRYWVLSVMCALIGTIIALIG